MSPKTKGSRRWSPLIFPKSALVSENFNNTNFPLDSNVMKAALRELLVLDKTVDPDMYVNQDPIPLLGKDGSNILGSRYMIHVDPEQWTQAFNSDKPKKKKRKVTEDPVVGDDRKERNQNSMTAEHIVETILHRVTRLEQSPLRRPRTISDADVPEKAEIDNMEKYLHISHDVVQLTSESKVPDFLEVSITTEAKLRRIARDRTMTLLETFPDKTLALFLGYKASTLPRVRFLEAISDLLFHNSHAIFAWRQTEKQIVGSYSREEKDKYIKSTLFDGRALQTIGGLDNTSILTHALSIENNEQSWTKQAKENSHFFAHYEDMSSIIQAGHQRRGNRLRQRPAEAGERSRSNSIETTFTDEGTVASLVTESFPSKITVRLERPEDRSWGVLLAKEGDVCVVVRGGKDGKDYLHSGDLVLGITDDQGQEVMTPSHHLFNHLESGDSWFSSIVDMFKNSRKLVVSIRRI